MSDDDKISFDAELRGMGRATIEVDDKIRYSIPETFEINVTAHITTDEIHRALRAQENHQYERAELQALFTSLNVMRDENDRLRAALEKCRDQFKWRAECFEAGAPNIATNAALNKTFALLCEQALSPKR